MKRANFAIYLNNQPNEAAWHAATEFAKRWNGSAVHRLESALSGQILEARAIDVADPEYRTLRAAFEELSRTDQVDTIIAVEDILEPRDIAVADFVSVFGVGIDDDAGNALGPLTPCAKCGYRDVNSRVQRGQFTLDEEQLHSPEHATHEGDTPGPGGWDMVNLPGGYLAVSTRVAQLLRERGATGWHERPILSRATGQVSRRMVQLCPTTFVPVPCLQHDSDEVTEFCSLCGTVLSGRLGAGWHVQRQLVGELSFFSRRPKLGGQLYIRKALYDELLAHGVSGLTVGSTAIVCDHALPSGSQIPK